MDLFPEARKLSKKEIKLSTVSFNGKQAHTEQGFYELKKGKSNFYLTPIKDPLTLSQFFPKEGPQWKPCFQLAAN